MGRLFAYLLISAELLAVAAFLGWLVVGDEELSLYSPRSALIVCVTALVAAAGISVTTHRRGIVRRFHDRCFENSWETTLRYLFFLRFHWIIALALLVFPGLAVMRLQRLLDSLFFVNAWELFFITWMGLLAAWSLMTSVQLTCLYGPIRFGGEPLRLRPKLRHWGGRLKLELFGLLVAPSVFFCLLNSSDWWGGFLATALGILAAWLTLFITTWQRESIVPACVPPSRLLLNGARYRRRPADATTMGEPAEGGIVLEALLRLLGPGYYDHERKQPQPGHMLSVTLMGLVLCTYGLVGFAFRPAGGWNDYFPSLGYLMNMFMLAAWGLPASAFFLDRWHIPVMGSLTITALMLYSLSETDHYYITKPVELERIVEAPSLTPQQTLDAWAEARGSRGDRMTVVMISGGGIAAAAWGTEVLTGLEEEIGAPFVQSLHALSSASGGSVCVMYYLDGFSPHGPRPPDELERIRDAATHSSLRAMSWGVAYPDVWRLMAPPVLTWAPYLDRGWALQEVWRRQMVEPQMTLYGWRSKIARGLLPVPLMDATAVESGRQFLLTPVDVRGPGASTQRFRSHHSFLHLYDGRDIDVVTAARLSATFPWVSPISRASLDSGGPEYHIADGAYLDNYGVTSMVEWLHSILPSYQRRYSNPEILLIRISIRESGFTEDADFEGQPGWTYTLYGPLVGLLNASQSSQIARNELLLDLFKERWTVGSGRRGVRLHVANFALRTEAPLSWQLTPQAREVIRNRWREEVEQGTELARIREFLTETRPANMVRGRRGPLPR